MKNVAVNDTHTKGTVKLKNVLGSNNLTLNTFIRKSGNDDNHLKWKLSVGSGKSTKFGCMWKYVIYERHTSRQTKCVIRVGHFSW